MPITISGSVAPKIGFASHQNAVPILRELEITNPAEDPVDDLELVVSADPPFLETKTWKVDRLIAGSTLQIHDRDLKLNGAYLGDLTETLRGEVRVRVGRSGEMVAETAFPVELLGRSEWGGIATMAELLPAFITPNDPAVDGLLRATSDVLRRAGKPDGIDGYESGSRSRVWQLVSAMWSAVAGKQITYALPPASFEMEGQRVRTPSAVLDGRVGTCLDTALLFAALIEQARLNPLVIITRGHAFVGAWLQPQEFSSLITEDAGSVRKRIDLQELVVFETTLVTQHPAPRFDQAIAAARQQIAREREDEFLMAIDVRRARMQRITPLATSIPIRQGASAGDVEETAEALLDAPQLPMFDVEVADESHDATDRVGQWKRKLLDLTTRNRLLHFPANARGVPLHCPDPALLEDRLADGRKVKVCSFPELEVAGRDSSLYQQRNRESLADEYAIQALDRGEVVSNLDAKKLESSLVELYRKAKLDLEEGGANTLFLALGFLHWKKAPEDPRTYRAPLILLPVKLDRRSVRSGVTLSAHEDEPRFNLTLLELLRHDFGLTIPGLDESLPQDESGIDVRGIWNTVRRHVRDLQGFEVVEDAVIGTFSFAKYLMWKDLVDREDQLKKSVLVKHLIERGAEPYEVTGSFPRVEELDQTVDPAELFAPLPADSSQVAAIVASGNGRDFVLDGPPGTGKSQTIANMIAHNLALGRRVLFVAEKRAALDVVYRRLEEKGLGEFCLELHSNKTSKVDVLKQLDRAWNARDTLSEDEWLREATEVRRLRDGLNDVVRLLHKVHPNGLTIHSAIGRVVRDHDASTPRLAWPDGTVHDAETLARFRDIARHLGIAGNQVKALPPELAALAHETWSNAWQEALLTAAKGILERFDSLFAARDDLVRAVQLTTVPADLAGMTAAADLVTVALATYGKDFRFAFAADQPARVSAARRAVELINECRSAEKSLSTRYSLDGVRRLDLDRYDRDLAEAADRFWFLATLARKRLAKQLKEEGRASGLPNVATDLPRLRALRDRLTELDGQTPLLDGVPGWTGLSSDVGEVGASADLAEGIRARLSAVASTPAELVELRRAISALIIDANELLSPTGPIALAHARLASELERFRAASDVLSKLAASTDLSLRLSFEEQRDLAEAIVEHQASLKSWCDWRRIENEALAAGLRAIAEVARAGTAGVTEGLFETAYARWFAAGAIDREPKLAGLITEIHENDIEAYRRLEDQLSLLTTRYIRAKLCGRIPDRSQVSRRDGYGVLLHQLQLQRRHKPIRQLASEMGDSFTALAPCMLMSPLSIAQYLPADQQLFDLVIFDEASQITPWDAIGSIARGRQVVIAGDPRQMPPTSFFNRAGDAGDDDASVEEDMESILDECLAAGVPRHSLDWHYRSRHESLIAFSNHRYYDSRLITFPNPQLRDSAVSWVRVDGIYARGSTRTNEIEARAMVEATVRRLTDPEFVAAGKTLAIVTMSAAQQKLIEDLLDEERRRDPEVERHFSSDLTEPVVVKNLETVQGDERDVILIGIGYGPTVPGARTMSMSFGPLNNEGGWRRLNVATTRARQEMVLFTSFDSGMIDLNRTSARAVRDLKHFLEFAERGPRALAEATDGSVGGFESPFEEAVAEALTRRGWTVVPQIGVSRFRIDIGIVHPDRPGDYLVGVECDGATYHSAATARDRDKVRAAILEGLGWKLLRVWSTDWWVNREGAADRLHREIEAELDRSRLESQRRKEAAEAAGQVARATPGAAHAPELAEPSDDVGTVQFASLVEPVSTGEPAIRSSAPPRGESLAAWPAEAGGPDAEGRPALRGPLYRVTDFAPVATRIEPERFYDDTYTPALAALIRHVVECESPIAEALLVERVARAHGFQRSGRIIRERVEEVTRRHFHLERGVGENDFVWLDADTPRSWFAYRAPASEEDVRPIEQVADAELAAAAAAKPHGDRPVEIARLFGIRRLSRSARDRIEEVIARWEGAQEPRQPVA